MSNYYSLLSQACLPAMTAQGVPASSANPPAGSNSRMTQAPAFHVLLKDTQLQLWPGPNRMETHWETWSGLDTPDQMGLWCSLRFLLKISGKACMMLCTDVLRLTLWGAYWAAKSMLKLVGYLLVFELICMTP